MGKVNKFNGILFAIVSSATFGFIPLFCIPLLKSGMSLDSICFYRFLFSVVFLVPVLIFNKISIKIELKQYAVLTLISVFYAATGVFLTSSYEYLPSGIATTIHFLYPVLVAIIMILFFKEKLSLQKFLSIIIAIVGVFYLCGGLSGFADGGISVKGLLLVLITVFTYGIYIVGVNNINLLKNINGLKLTFYVLLNSAFFFLIYILIIGDSIEPISCKLQWQNLILLSIVPTLISNLCLIYAIKLIGSTTTAILGCMEPLTAVVIGFSIFNEILGIKQILGLSLILIAVTMVIFAQSKKKSNPL